MDKTDSDSISDLIIECQALVNEQISLEESLSVKTEDEMLLDFLLKDEQSEIRRNKLKIQKLQDKIEQERLPLYDKLKKIEEEKLLKKKKIRDLIKKRLREIRIKLDSALSDNNSNETSKYTKLLTKTASNYNEILDLLHYKRVQMKTLFDSSGGGSKLL